MTIAEPATTTPAAGFATTTTTETAGADMASWLEANPGSYIAVRFSTGRYAARFYTAAGHTFLVVGAEGTKAAFAAVAAAGVFVYSEDAPLLERDHAGFFLAIGSPAIRNARAIDMVLAPERYKKAPTPGTPLAAHLESLYETSTPTTRRIASLVQDECALWRRAAARGYRVDPYAIAEARQQRSAVLDAFQQEHGLDVRRPDLFRAHWARALGAKVEQTEDFGWSAHSSLDLSEVPEENRAAFDGYKAACSALKRLQILNGIHRRTDADGRVHPLIVVNSASTGRMSIREPGMQSLMTELRPIFLAEPGYDIVSVDHSSAELLTLARLVGSPSFTARVTGSDPYQQLADLSAVIDRKTAKWILLAWCYGQTLGSLGKKIGAAEARQVHEAIAILFPEVVAWRAEQTARAVAQDPLTTLWGRPLPQLVGRRAGQLGLAANLQVQGSARDAYGKGVRRAAAALGADSLWFPLHDELFVLSRSGESEATAATLLTAMTVSLGEGVVMGGKSKVTFGRWG